MQWNFELIVKPSEPPLTEGPVWDGEFLYFTHIRASRIMRYDPKTGAVTVGPATTGLTPVKVVRGASGDLYAV